MRCRYRRTMSDRPVPVQYDLAKFREDLEAIRTGVSPHMLPICALRSWHGQLSSWPGKICEYAVYGLRRATYLLHSIRCDDLCIIHLCDEVCIGATRAAPCHYAV